MRKRTKLLLYCIVVFLFQEVVFRFCFPVGELSNFDRTPYMAMNPTSVDSGFMRGVNRDWCSLPDTNARFLHEMNFYGFRDGPWALEKTPSKQRVLFIGDSFVEGIMAPQNETIPQGFLKEVGADAVEVMNGGMTGVSMNSYLQFAADALPLFQPDVAVLCLYSNDLGQTEPNIPTASLYPSYFEWYRPRIIEVLANYAWNKTIRFRYDNTVAPYLTPVPSAGNPWTFQLERYTPHVSPEYATLMKQGAFNPYRVNALHDEELYFKRMPRTGYAIAYFKQLCERNGVQPVIVYIPSRNQVTKHYYPYEFNFCTQMCPDTLDLTQPQYQLHQQVIGQQCAQHDVQYIDLTPVIKEHEARGHHLFWNYDEHMRGVGYLLLGKTIALEWQEQSFTN